MPEGVLTPRLVVALGVTRWNRDRMPMRRLRNRYLALDDGLQQFHPCRAHRPALEIIPLQRSPLLPVLLRPPPRSTLLPIPTLFRSHHHHLPARSPASRYP